MIEQSTIFPILNICFIRSNQIIHSYSKMIKIVLILIFTSLSHTLHTYHSIHSLIDKRNLHLQTKSTDSHIDEIFTIKTLSQKITKSLKQTNPQKYNFLITKSSQIQQSLSNLQQTLLKYNLSISNESKLCPGVTTFNRTQIRLDIIDIQLNQKDSVQYLSTCIDCSFVTDQILNIQKNTKLFVKKVNQTLDGVYCSSEKVRTEKATGIVNLNSSYFKNNLNAKNWYYGSTTASDYKLYIFQRSAKYNLTSCPLNKPFVKDEEQICFDCPEGSIFNIGKRNCDTCSPSQILNVVSGSCDSCLGQKKVVDGSLVCRLCILADGELFNSTSGHCYKCNNHAYLDTDKLACLQINCPTNTPRFNRTTKQCSACPQSQAIDPNDPTKCIKTNYIGLCNPSTPKYDTATKICTACQVGTVYNRNTNECDKPSTSHQTSVNRLSHYDSNTPIQCPADKPYFNPNTNQCQSCNQGEFYNTVQKRCKIKITCGSTETFNPTTYTCVDTASTCRESQIYILKVNRCLPKSVTCDQNQFYNPQTKLCTEISINCKIDQYYDVKNKHCSPKRLRCKANQQYNQELKICQQLILCKDNQYYNRKSNVCQNARMKCDPLKQYYKEDSKICVDIIQLTSPYSKNLIIPPSFSYGQFIKTYTESIKLPYVKDCPPQTPFFIENKCASCPTQTPYFNIAQSQCVKCQSPSGQGYIRNCLGQQQVKNIPQTISRINI